MTQSKSIPFTLLLALATILAGVNSSANEQSDLSADQVVSCYVQALDAQKTKSWGTISALHMTANLPKSEKNGTMDVEQEITTTGLKKFHHPRYSENIDGIIKNVVFHRFLQTEADESTKDHSDIEVTPANYKFKLKGQGEIGGRTAFVYELKPRKKKIGLFKGQIVIDTATCLPLREEGQLVKTPSIMVKKVKFSREFDIVGDTAVLKSIDSQSEAHMVGPVNVRIEFTQLSEQVAHAQ